VFNDIFLNTCFIFSLAVITGLIEILSRRIQKVRESIEGNKSVMLGLLTTLGFLSRFIDVCQPGESYWTASVSQQKSHLVEGK